MILTKEEYRRGRKFRVVKIGASIRGLVPAGPWCHRGHLVELDVGTVITCLGVGWTRGDGGPFIGWGDETGLPYCSEGEFFPHNGNLWNCLPEDDYLQPID